jgi:hypothetical protein
VGSYSGSDAAYVDLGPRPGHLADILLASLRLLTAKPSSSTQAMKSKSGSRLKREPEGPRAGELKVLSILATGIPENMTLFGPTLSCTKGYLRLPLAGFAR